MGENDVNQTISEPNAVNQSTSEPNVENQQVSEPDTIISEPKTTISESNVNVLKVINALSQNSALISKSAQCKLTGVFAVSLSDLADEPKSFTGKVTAFALIVNTFNVRTLKRSLNDIKHLEVTTDAQLYDNNLPNSCYRTRWTVQMGDGTFGSCTAMRGSDKIEYGSDVTVTLSKGTYNNANFVKSVINKR